MRSAGDVYKQLAPAVFGYMRAQRVPDAEDVAGEVFLQVARDLHRFSGDDDDLRRWVLTLAAKEGLWPEASSAAPFAAIERLRGQGTIKPDERCVALLTAAGLKDPGPIETALPEPPLVSGGLKELTAALATAYGFHG